MTFKAFLRLIWRNALVLILLPLTLAAAVYLLSKNTPKVYQSSAMIYTNASTAEGGSVSAEPVRVDFYTSNNLYDNLVLLLKSRETIEETSLRLLALHISMKSADSKRIGKEAFNELYKHISPSLKSALMVADNPGATYERIRSYRDTTPDSPVDYLLREHPNYAIQKILDRLSVGRKYSSDMIELSFRGYDPGVCQYTLRYLIESFMERYRDLKELENINSIRYFEEQIKIAQDKLRTSEASLKSFISENRILNFYEQGKYLDIAKLEQDQDEEKARRLYKGASTNLDNLQSLFEVYEGRGKQIDELMTIQRDMNARRNELEGMKLSPQANKTGIASLEEQIRQMEKSSEELSYRLYQTSNTNEGISRKTLLDEWLKLKIQSEDQNQALEVMRDRKRYINSKIEEFAPLGAELKKLEREVSVNESQYLSILHGLNLAYLQKYDLEMTSAQKLIDQPNYPSSPIPSRRLFLVAGACLAGFLLILSFLIARYLLDSSIRSVKRAAEFSGLPVSSIFPDRSRNRWRVDYASIDASQEKQLLSQVKMALAPGKTGPSLILLHSSEEKEGKSYVAQKLAERLARVDGRVLWLVPGQPGHSNMPAGKGVTVLNYRVSDHFINISGPQELVPAEDLQAYNHIIIELPALVAQAIPYRLVGAADLSLMVLRADRSWTETDHNLTALYHQNAAGQHLLVLNRVDLDNLVTVLGNIPRRPLWGGARQLKTA